MVIERTGQRTDPHMRETDAFSWYMERDPLLRSTVVTVMVLDRAPDQRRMRARLERATRLVPGLRHHLVEAPLRLAPPRWVVDENFDLSWHVRLIRAPAPGDLGSVLDLARKDGMEAFDPARPLWTWTTVEGLAGGRAAVILKIHHSLTDGIGGMQLATELFDLERDGAEPGPGPAAPAPEHLGRGALTLDALAYEVIRFVGAGAAALAAAPRALPRVARHPIATTHDVVRVGGSILRTVRPIQETLSPLMHDRHLGWRYATLDLALGDLKRAARVAGGTLNDAFLAGIADGLRRYHDHHGCAVPELRVTMPISIRAEGDPAGGNRITLMRFAVPVDAPDPAARMQVLHELAAASRAEPSIPLTNAIAGMLNLLPRGVVGSMLKHVDFLASNVPGIGVPIHIGGAQVVALYPFGPTIGAALNVTLLSYCETCHIGVNTDAGAVPDPNLLLECFRAGFEELLDLGGPHAAVTTTFVEEEDPC
jgi:WS/DGAT/MGAT family acyltransferase